MKQDSYDALWLEGARLWQRMKRGAEALDHQQYQLQSGWIVLAPDDEAAECRRWKHFWCLI